MGVMETIRCVVCGHDRRPTAFGLVPDGRFDAATAQPNELELRRKHFVGSRNIRHEVTSLPIHFALGLRDMLKYRLAQVEAEIRAAGVTLDDD